VCNVARVRGSCIMNVPRRGSRDLGMEANDLSDGRSLCYGRFPDKAHLIGCHRRDDGGIIPIAIGCPLIIGVVELDEQGPAAEDFQHCSLPPRREIVRRERRHQFDDIQFIAHGASHFLAEYAREKRGIISPSRIYHVVRTDGLRPSGVISAPTTA